MGLAAIDENRSAWAADLPPYEPTAPLRGRAAADVAIVGAGLTGVSTAWHLSRRFPDRRIVLLEARVLGNGASGRNGGQALSWINGVPTTDPELARRVFALTRDGIDLIESLAREHAPAAGFTRNGCLEVYTDQRNAELGQAQVERLRGLGVPLRWLSGREAGVHGACGATLDPTAGQLSTLALLRGLRPALLAAGVALYEASPVLRIVPGRTICLTTPQGELRAAALVLATNAYTPALGWFRHAMLPLHSHVLATAPLSPAARSALGWGSADGFSDDLDRIAYGCRTGSGRLVFGGGSNAAYRYLYGGRTALAGPDGAARRAEAAIRDTMARYFPGLKDVAPAAAWAGTLAITLDRVCTIGVGGEAANVYHALGYSGHGVVLAMLAGRILCDLYAGDHEPWRDFPFYQRRPPRLPPEPLRWLGYQIYTRLTGRSPRRPA